MALVFSLFFYTYTQTDIHFRGAAMNFSQARPRAIEGLLKEKVLLMKPPNLGKTAILWSYL